MRSFIIGLSLLMMFLSPSLASGTCTEITNAPGKKVKWDARGYEPVRILITLPVEKGDTEDSKYQKGLALIAFSSLDPLVRPDFAYLKTVTRCSYDLPGGKRNDRTLIQVGVYIAADIKAEGSYTLRTAIMLPKSLLKKRPNVETELDTGRILRGHWRQGRILLPVVKKGKKGKAVTVNVKKTYTELILAPD